MSSINKLCSDLMQLVRSRWQGQPSEGLNASIVSSGDTVAPNIIGTIEWASTPLLLKPPGLCPLRSLRDRSCPLVCTTEGMILTLSPGCQCLWSVGQNSHMPHHGPAHSTWIIPGLILFRRTQLPCPWAHFRFNDCMLVKMAELNYLCSVHPSLSVTEMLRF